METKKYIEKNKKYLFSFPEGTTAEKQAEYLQKVSEKLKTDQFVAIDPKIRIHAATEQQEVIEDVKETKTPNDKMDDKKTETDDSKDKETNTTSKGTTETTPDPKETTPTEEVKTDKVTIEKIEVPAKEETPKEDHPFLKE